MSAKLPIITIAGRQNVGKSTLFNAIIREKRAIVDSLPGLTRDILAYDVTYNDITFTLTDSPGLDLPATAELSKTIIDNAKRHLEKSSIIILLLEYPAPESFDLDLTDMIRKLNIPTIVAVNKMDNPERMECMTAFYETGLTELIPISALRRFNVDNLLDTAIEFLPAKKTAIRQPDVRIAIVGRPNAGKSTLLNSFLGYERSMVSDIPGTTRDPVNDTFQFQGRLIEIIDTAGMRKKSKVVEGVEYYSLRRTMESIKRSEVVIHLLDAEDGLTDTDKKISDEIIEARKPAVLALNKWDKVENKDDKTFERFRDHLINRFYRAADFPIISISAKDKQRIHKLLTTVLDVRERSQKRIDTPNLNRVIDRLVKSGKIPALGSTAKIYYATQTHSQPPAFRFFVNNVDQFRPEIIRFFEKALQKEFNLSGIPVVIEVVGKEKKDRRKSK